MQAFASKERWLGSKRVTVGKYALGAWTSEGRISRDSSRDAGLPIHPVTFVSFLRCTFQVGEASPQPICRYCSRKHHIAAHGRLYSASQLGREIPLTLSKEQIPLHDEEGQSHIDPCLPRSMATPNSGHPKFEAEHNGYFGLRLTSGLSSLRFREYHSTCLHCNLPASPIFACILINTVLVLPRDVQPCRRSHRSARDNFNRTHHSTIRSRLSFVGCIATTTQSLSSPTCCHNSDLSQPGARAASRSRCQSSQVDVCLSYAAYPLERRPKLIRIGIIDSIGSRRGRSASVPIRSPVFCLRNHRLQYNFPS